MEDKNYNKIEDMKNHLYNRSDILSGHQIEGELHKIRYKTETDWSKEDNLENQEKDKKMKKNKMSVFKKFFIVAIIFFVVAIGFAFYKFSNGGTSVSNSKIDIEVLGNAFTKGGEELSLEIKIINHNNANLEMSDLMISYPNGADNNTTNITRLAVNKIGTIKPGETVIRNIKVTLFGQEKSVRNVNINLDYHPGGSNAIFTKKKIFLITISSAPLSLSINAPEKEISNKDFSFNVKVALNTSLPNVNPTILQLSYPSNFIFESAIPSATFSNTTWNLSSLSTTNPFTVVITGRLIGQDGDEQVFHAYAGSANPDNQSVVDVTYNSLIHKIFITKPFLEADILVNNQNSLSYTASSGDLISAQINWVNNLSTLVTNAKIIVGITGNTLDKSSINPGAGFYNSINNQIIWDKNSVSKLASIEPGGKGSLSFKFKSISLIGDTNLIKDPQITINVSISGKQPDISSASSNISNISTRTIKILSNLQIASSARYSSGFFPPKAEKETKYIVVWTLSNTSNTIIGAQAKSILPIYINWVGSLAGGNEDISFNKETREVVWNIGTVDPNVGFSSNREISFMISIRPSLSQIGSIPQLMKGIILSGTDSFAEIPVQSTYRAITTMLTDDPTFETGDQIVVK